MERYLENIIPSHPMVQLILAAILISISSWIKPNYAMSILPALGGVAVIHWSGQIMLFLLFAVTLRWLLREKILAGGMRLWEKVTAYGLYLAHLAAGAAYYVYCMVSIHYR